MIRCVFSGAVFVRNPINRELVATFEIIVSVHDNASDVIDKSGSVPNGNSNIRPILSFLQTLTIHYFTLVSM